MKLNQIKLIALLSIIVFFSHSCKDQKTETNTKKDYLAELTKASEDDFSGQQIMLDGESIPIYNLEGKRIRGMEMMQTLMSGDYTPDFYKDKNDEIKAAVLRKATKEEKESMSKMPMNPQENTEADKAPMPFSAIDMEGNEYSLNNLKGKIIVMNFWFAECKPCIMEMPELNEIVKKYENKNVVFLGFATNEKSRIESFLKKHDFSYNIIPDSRKIAADYGVSSYPTHIIVDKNSKTVFSVSGLGPTTMNDIDTTIKNLIKK